MDGERIRILREERGMKISQLGEMIGVNASYISRAERNLVPFSNEVLDKIANTLEISKFDVYMAAGKFKDNGMNDFQLKVLKLVFDSGMFEIE